MTNHQVIIVGAGPTGLMLAGELALAGVDVAVVERRASHELAGLRAGGLHARTIEVFDQRGIAERFLAAGKTAQVAGFGGVPLDISDFPTRHNYGLALWQGEIERILGEWVAELPVTIHRECEVTGFDQDERGVEVRLGHGRSLRCAYLVGCDGGRSQVRRAAGIDFVGTEATRSYLIAEVRVAGTPEWGLRRDDRGIHGLSPLEGGGARMVSSEREVRHGRPTEGDVRDALVALYGTDFELEEVMWLSRFTNATRQATTYRARRVLLAGDAAHTHSPAGGQGLNIGVQDAVNLGWKLGRVVRGLSKEALLDTYEAERYPIAARVLKTTLAASALETGDPGTEALREAIADLLKSDDARRRYAGMMSGLDVIYAVGEGHPLLGRRVPDVELRTARGTRRMFELLHAARPVLVSLGSGIEECAGIDVVEAEYDGAWEIPVHGWVEAPSALLVRPDGYVAWVGSGDRVGLARAVEDWFGSK